MARRTIWLGMIIGVMILAISGMGCAARVEPGQVGIKVNYYGSQRGVEDFPLQTGMVWYNAISEKVLVYPIYVQTAVWTASLHEGKAVNEEITFNSKEGLVISADVSFSYQLQREKVPHFYIKFRSDDLNTFTHGFLRNIARDAFNETATLYSVEELYGVKKEEFLMKVKDKINKDVLPFGVEMVQLGFTGAMRIPPAVTESLNAKIQAIQDATKVENQIRQAKAEAQKKIATAEGEARANMILAQSITPNLIVWRQLDLTTIWIAKWNGQRPMVEGQGAGLLMQLPSMAQSK